MSEVPAAVYRRCLAYCRQNALEIEGLRGYGLDGFVWQTKQDSILKVGRRKKEFLQELAVYQRLQAHHVERLQGFHVPILLHYDKKRLELELSYVRPPFVLDFAAAALDHPGDEFDTESAEWIAEKRRIYGQRWPEVVRLLDVLRHMGIFYTDVHLDNIRIDPSD